MKIAVVGSGISGLGCAHALLHESALDPSPVELTLYEADARLGGHTNTVDVRVQDTDFAVDTGFLVFNERTYPNLIRLFDELRVPIAASDMSFAVSTPIDGAFGTRMLEWSGTNLATVFAQRRNLLSPRFVSMLADLLRFNREATALALAATPSTATLGEFLDASGYGEPFRRWYLLPMAGAIWSCPTQTMLAYPAATFARFCHNHGLLQISDRPRWFTVAGGARQYVRAIASRVERRHRIRLGDPVHEVRRIAGRVQITSAHGREMFDHVVLACHSDQSRALLRDADADEARVLAGVSYQRNRAILHTDVALLPRSRKVWSAWNAMSCGGDEPDVCVSYLLNKLQPLPVSAPVIVTLNPIAEPRADAVIAQFDYEHPIFDAAAIDAQRRLPAVQGRRRVWFAGAWTGYGFHEDGLTSGVAVAEALAGLSRERQAA